MEKLKLAIILCCLTLVVSCVVFVATSCTWTREPAVSDKSLEESYEKVHLSSGSQEELVASLVEFEAENPSHFKSKLDLAQWYFSLGNHAHPASEQGHIRIWLSGIFPWGIMSLAGSGAAGA